MKNTVRYLLFIVALVVAVVVFQMAMPHRFDWTPSFGHDDKNPFGGYVFDSLMAQTLPQGYRAEGTTLRQAAHDSVLRNVLVVTDGARLTSANVTDISHLLSRGATVMLVGVDIPPGDSAYAVYHMATTTYNHFDLQYVVRGIAKHSPYIYDTIYYRYSPRVQTADTRCRQAGPRYANAEYRVLDDLVCSYIESDTARAHRGKMRAIAYMAKGHSYMDQPPGHHFTVAALQPRGRGRLVLVSTPLLFTNHGILDPASRPYVLRLMNLLSARATVRLDASMAAGAVIGTEADKHNETALSFIAAHTALRWAYYTLLVGLVLFFVFTAKRRQRVIPIITAPANNDLEFVKLIGRLYFERHDNADLVLKRYAALADTLRTDEDIDLTDRRRLEDNLEEVAQLTGLPVADIRRLVNEVRNLRDQQLQVDDATMMRLVRQMDELTQRL